MAKVEEKSMVPTVLVGVGGTGTEVLSRVRRLVEETYGSLDNFPIISFLIIDTDKDYKVTNPLSAGSEFKDNEKYWASVKGTQVQEMISDMSSYPWIESWFPRELDRNMNAIEKGAGQIRACGRFAFFCNYHDIQKKFIQACNRVKGKENFMLDKHGIKVSTNAINVFVTGSLSGGTGSGMLIDIGYAIRQWLRGEGSPEITAIVPMPNAFAGINVGDRVMANGYAALMELSYFSDYKTEYVANYSAGTTDEVRSIQPPFDFTYLVGTKNDEIQFKLEQIREMIAQNIFLDLTSDFAPHKRSIRDNIKGAWANQDSGGRGYPKNFMSFGLSTIEIPIFHIRASLSNRLANDLINWWLNPSAILPPQMRDFVTAILKDMRLTEAELIADLSAASDRSYTAVISQWINSIRNEIATENKLQCTQKGLNVAGRETGKILTFLDYLQPKVDEYRSNHLRELSPDERQHGDYLQKMYENRNQTISLAKQALEKELYRILEDRTQGPKFAQKFIETVRQILDDVAVKFRKKSENIGQNETKRQEQYEKALQDISHFKDRFGVTKQAKMEEYCETALIGLESCLIATIQRKARANGIEVIARLREHLNELEQRLATLNQRLIQSRDYFKRRADAQANSADALQINGIKLFDRRELNKLYQDLIEQQVQDSEGNQTRYEIGLNAICSTMSAEILKQTSPLWEENRAAEQVMQLFDLANLPDVLEDDFRGIIAQRTLIVIKNAPDSTKLKTDLAACDRMFAIYNNQGQITNNIRIAYHKSGPLIVLSKEKLQAANFTPALNTKVALLGGQNTKDPAAKKMIPFVQEFVNAYDAITPLGEPERHRIVFVQEIGGFSLRCIEGMSQLRKSYQDWKGEAIVAKRAQLRGENRDLPIPVHMQKEPPFWDIFPEDGNVFKLVILARALKVLRLEENRASKEKVIRYTRATAIGSENVDIASSWQEAIQNLEVAACRQDREAIERKITQKITAAETPKQKHSLFNELATYLEKRADDLLKLGGKDNPEYKREATIILEIINTHKLKQDIKDTPPEPEISTTLETLPIPSETHIFCTSCGAKNSANSKFCSNCGKPLGQ